jgi:glucokinase
MPEAKGNPEFVVGVDLGGTKIQAGVYDARLSLIGSAKVSTKAERGVGDVLDRLTRCVHEAVDECDLGIKQVFAVGIGAPGAVDSDEGRVVFAPNLGWKDVPLRKELEKRLEIPVFVENDCNLCALGVHVHELGGKPRHMIGLFIGTGIGAGLILNGELYTGHNHCAGEVGHMVILAGGPRCACGNNGCFEAMASRTAIFKRIAAGLKDGEKTVLTEALGENLKDLRSGDLRRAIRRGDKFVAKVVEEAANYIGLAVGNLINIFGPEVVMLGGGVIEALEQEVMPTITKSALEHVLPGTARDVEIMASKLADNAGIAGGAVLARRGTK